MRDANFKVIPKPTCKMSSSWSCRESSWPSATSEEDHCESLFSHSLVKVGCCGRSLSLQMLRGFSWFGAGTSAAKGGGRFRARLRSVDLLTGHSVWAPCSRHFAGTESLPKSEGRSLQQMPPDGPIHCDCSRRDPKRSDDDLTCALSCFTAN